MSTAERPYYIYCHTAPNGKRYIGQTCQKLGARWSHGNGYTDQPYFKNAIDKYGWENFRHDIFAVVHSKAVADLYEQYYIEKYDTFSSEHGYNLTKGGGGCVGKKMSEENKRILAKFNQDRVITDEQRAQISKTLKEGYRTGRISVTPMSKERLEQLRKERSGSGNPMFGKHHSDEAREKIGNASRGKRRPDKWKRNISQGRLNSSKIKRFAVDQYDIDGNFIATFPSLKDAERATGVFSTNISSCCRGKYRQSGGYVFRYHEAA